VVEVRLTGEGADSTQYFRLTGEGADSTQYFRLAKEVAARG
jgi:hypothetical protein